MTSDKKRDVLAWFDKFASKNKKRIRQIDLPSDTNDWSQDWKSRCAELGDFYQRGGLSFEAAFDLAVRAIRHGALMGLGPIRSREAGKRINVNNRQPQDDETPQQQHWQERD